MHAAWVGNLLRRWSPTATTVPQGAIGHTGYTGTGL
jgi:hypothetical protein